MRIESDLGILGSTCEKFCKVLEKHCKYIVVSGFVAIATGRSRGTEDIDIITERMPLEVFIRLHHELQLNGFECIQEVNPLEIYNKYLVDSLPVRYILKNQLLPELEVKFAKDFLDNSQLNNRIKIPLTNLDVWFSSIETNIAFKEELLKSDKDLEDSRHLRRVFQGQLNGAKIKEIKKLIKRYRLNGPK